MMIPTVMRNENVAGASFRSEEISCQDTGVTHSRDAIGFALFLIKLQNLLYARSNDHGMGALVVRTELLKDLAPECFAGLPLLFQPVHQTPAPVVTLPLRLG